MLRYTSQHCTPAHRNVRLGIRGFVKLMCLPFYFCLFVLYFLFAWEDFGWICFIFHFYTQKLLTNTICEKQMCYFLYLRTVNLSITYRNRWIISAAVNPFTFLYFPPVNLGNSLFNAIVRFIVIFVYICVYVASLWIND